jgi:hypothetical protein
VYTSSKNHQLACTLKDDSQLEHIPVYSPCLCHCNISAIMMLFNLPVCEHMARNSIRWEHQVFCSISTASEFLEGLESGGSGFETCSGVILQAELLKCGHNFLGRCPRPGGPCVLDKGYTVIHTAVTFCHDHVVADTTQSHGDCRYYFRITDAFQFCLYLGLIHTSELLALFA